MNVARSVCPYDCPDACGLLVQTEGGAVRSVRGDPDHGYTHGALCPKVNGYQKTVHSPDRLLTPLIRTGPKGAAAFRQASWPEALELIAAKWKALIAAHGAQCLLPVSYAGTMGQLHRHALEPLFHRLGASRLDRTICTPAQNEGWRMVMGQTLGPDPDEAEASDLVVLWGCHALATNLHFLARVKKARQRGGRAFLIDTWRQPTAAHVDRVFLVKPGSDGALALGMLHLLARDGRLDRSFLAANADGWDELEAMVLPDFTPARVTALTGLSLTELEELTQAYGAARAPFIRLGGGLSRYGNGAMNTRLLCCLPAAVGAWGKPGGGLLAGLSTGAAFDLSGLTREDLQPGPTRLINLNRLGHALTELSPAVHGIYVSHCNPAAVCPDQNAVLQGLSRDDLFTVVHERFMTDTARYADVVLPAPTMLETEDIYRSYGQFYVQRVKAAVPCVGESRSNWHTIQALAAAMGLTDEVFTCSAEQHLDRMVASVKAPWLDEAGKAALNAGQPVRFSPPRSGWLTPTGRIQLRNDALELPLPRHLPSHEDSGTLPLRLQTTPSLHRLNSSFAEREDLSARLGPQALQLSPLDAQARGLTHGQRVTAFNQLGEVAFTLVVTDTVPQGVAVAEGVHWLAAGGNLRTVNALTSQRLTDAGAGSTFYDNRVDVRAG